MNTRNKLVFAAFLAGAAVIGSYRPGAAAAKDSIGPARVGIVDVTAILENSKKHKQWQEKMRVEEEKIRAEFQALRDELKALEGTIGVLNRGSSDYFSRMEEYSQKKAAFDAKNTFYEEKVTSQMQQWTETLYRDFLNVLEKVALDKELDVILANEQLDLPAPSLRDFMLTVKTKKVLYHQKSLDVTEDALRALDEMN